MKLKKILTQSHLVYPILAGAIIMISGCTQIPPATATPAAARPADLSGTLTGTVTYLERIALAPDAVVEVTLQEVSRADAPATVIATQTIEPKGAQVPLAFTLTYDPAQITPRDIWAVRATIKEGGQLTWTSTRRYPVITQDAPADNVEIIVEQVARSQGQTGAAASGVLTGTVTYLNRIALPPTAVIEVQLQDVTLADAPATVVATQRVESGGRQVPIPFELVYDPGQIREGRIYAMSARITVDGALRYINTAIQRVLTGDSPTTNIEVVVQPVQGG